MTKTIFRSTFLVGLLVLILCGVLFFWLRYNQTEEETYDALRQEAVYAEQGLLIGGMPLFDAINISAATAGTGGFSCDPAGMPYSSGRKRKPSSPRMVATWPGHRKP